MLCLCHATELLLSGELGAVDRAAVAETREKGYVSVATLTLPAQMRV